MKKSLMYIAVVAACLLAIVGCNSKEKQVVGTWKIDTSSLQSQIPASMKGSSMATKILEGISSVTIEFKSDHTVTTAAQGKSQQGTWKLEGSKLTLSGGKGGDQAATLSEDGKTITITPPANAQTGQSQTVTLIKQS